MNVKPTTIMHHKPYCLSGNSEGTCDVRLTFSLCEALLYFAYLFVVQFGVGALIAACATTFAVPVYIVLAHSTDEQMVWVYADRIVAMVAYALVSSIHSVVQVVSYAICLEVLTVSGVEHSVAIPVESAGVGPTLAYE